MNINREIQDYILEHLDTDVMQLALKKNPFPDTDWKWIVNQIHARQKAKTKLPSWHNNPHIIFPATLSIEQSTAEELAQFKATLFSGKKGIDLTAGFGIDAYYMSQNFDAYTLCEMNEDLAKVVQHNFQQLNNKSEIHTGNSLDFLKNTPSTFDWIYIDPARRDTNKNKVFLFEDCTPSVVEHIDLLFSKTQQIAIKSSPLIDLQSGIQELQYIKKIYILALRNEVKELLWILDHQNTTTRVEIEAICIENKGITHYPTTFEEAEQPPLELPQKYLFEPNAAVMKTNRFFALCQQFNIKKLHPHSHLFTSDTLPKQTFPGRTFEIQQLIPFHKKEMKPFEKQKLNITTRNFPLSVADIRKKYNISDGGNSYAFFTTLSNQEKVMILCKKTN